MEEIKLYKSAWKGIKLMAICLPFVILGIFILYKGGAFWVGLLNILFFGLSIPLGLYHIIDRRPQIIINEIGIFDRTIHRDFINWEIIVEAYPMSISSQYFVCLIVLPSFKPSLKRGKWYRRIAKLNESIGAQELNLNVGQLQVDPIKLSIFINLMAKAMPIERKERLSAGI